MLMLKLFHFHAQQEGFCRFAVFFPGPQVLQFQLPGSLSRRYKAEDLILTLTNFAALWPRFDLWLSTRLEHVGGWVGDLPAVAGSCITGKYHFKALSRM